MPANYLRSVNNPTQQRLNAAAHLQSTAMPVLKLNAFAVRAYLEGLDYAELTYKECMDLLQELLELPQSAGIPLARRDDSTDERGHLEDFSTFVVEKMIEAGYDREVAWKCRNSAAAKAAGGVKLKVFRLREAYHQTLSAIGDTSWDLERVVTTTSEDLAAAMVDCE